MVACLPNDWTVSSPARSSAAKPSGAPVSPRAPRGGERRPTRSPLLTAAVALSVVAVAASLAGFAIALTRGPATDACRSLAWNAVPEAAALPVGWSIVSSHVFVDNLSVSMGGPGASGGSAMGANLSVSCFGSDAALALTRSHDSALAAGAAEASFPTIGDESLAVRTAAAGTVSFWVRHGELVAEGTASGGISQGDLEALARALDAGMARAVAGSPPPAAVALGSEPSAAAASASSVASPAASAAPSGSAVAVSHAAPDLEAHLPTQVDGTALTSQSTIATNAITNDAASRSLVTTLAKLGKTTDQLVIAAAYDPTGKLDLRIFAFRLLGATETQVRTVLIDGWLNSGSNPPTSSTITVSGEPVTKLRYAQATGADYIVSRGDLVFDIETADETLVAKVLATLR